MRSVEEHLQRVLAGVVPLSPLDVTLHDARGCVLAEDVTAPWPLPPFDNSAMDGYAVVAADVADASPEQPVRLPVVGEIGAGQANLLAMSPGSAVKIMTGAPVPAGCDAVVPYEWTDRGVARVEISEAPQVGQNIRRAGEDVAAGDLLVREGTVLGPRHLGLLAAVGRATVQARPRPRVVIISTGSELREVGTPLSRDAIYDGNSFLLAAAARRAGVVLLTCGTYGNVVRFLPPLVISEELLREGLVVVSEALAAA